MNLTFFIIYYFLLLISVLGYGFFFKRIFLTISDDKNLDKFIGFYGLTLITFISYITVFFYKHHYVHNIIIHIFGVIFFLTYFNKKNVEYYKNLFFLSILVFPLILTSKTSDDFPYYHLPYTLYLIENKIIFGMGHLNHGYNLLSSIFYLNSTFFLPGINIYSFHFSYAYFLIFFNYFCLIEIFKSKEVNFIRIFYFMAFLYFNLA